MKKSDSENDPRFFVCPSCKERTFIKTEKKYDGFKVIGKKKVCAFCGYEFKSDEEINYIKNKPLFNDADEIKNFCRDCQYYVVNPWIQKCTLKNEEVTALDGCSEYIERKEID